MKPPEIPENDDQRLDTLHSLNILDTPAEERFDRLTRLAKRLFDVPISLITLVDRERQWFKSNQGLDITETSRDISFCGHTILGDVPFIINDTTKDDRFVDNPFVINNPNVRFYAGHPLHYLKDSTIGTLCIMDNRPRNFDEDDIRLLKDLAVLAERELMEIQLATVDELTKISNRRGFLSIAQNSLELCNRKRIPLTLVFLDLDQFKRINNNHGHAEGDRVLTAIAQTMKETIRDSDVYGRIGSDEFAILLTDTTIIAAKAVIARFRQAIQNYNNQATRGYDITFSEVLVTVNRNHDKSIETLLKRADTLMYENKSV